MNEPSDQAPLEHPKSRLQQKEKDLAAQTRKQIEAYKQGTRQHTLMDPVFHVIGIIHAVVVQFIDKRVPQRAAGLAYFLLLGFIPMLMMLIIATEMFGFTHVVGEFVVDAVMANYFPVQKAAAMESIVQWLENLRTGFAGGIGILTIAYSALNTFSGLYLLINDLWQVSSSGKFRGQLIHRLKAALYTFVLLPVALLASTILTARFGGIRYVGSFAAWLIAYSLVFTIILVLLKVTTRVHVRWKPALIASSVGALIFEVGKYLFALYVHEMMEGSWFSIYGAIFLIPVFMLWNMITAYILAVTASLSWVLQNTEEAFESAGIASPYFGHDDEDAPAEVGV